MQKQLGITGHIHGYDFFVIDDFIKVLKGEQAKAEGIIDGFSKFALKAKDLKVGWGQFPSGDEVIYLYDKDDDNFGYALNLNDHQCSEWGYAPFAND